MAVEDNPLSCVEGFLRRGVFGTSLLAVVIGIHQSLRTARWVSHASVKFIQEIILFSILTASYSYGGVGAIN